MKRQRYRTARPYKLVDAGSGAYLSTTDAMWTGAIDEAAFTVELWLTMSDWTPAANAELIRHGSADGNRSWTVEMQTTGRLRSSYFPAGTVASRVGTEMAVDFDPPLTNGRMYGLRMSFLSNLFGVASAYSYEVNYGGRWQQVGGVVTAALVGTPFNSSASLTMGEPGGATDLYAARVWSGRVGGSQLFAGTTALNPGIGIRRPGETSWPDVINPGVTWTVGAASLARSDHPLPLAV